MGIPVGLNLATYFQTDAEAEAPVLWPPDAESTHWRRPWCWERLKAQEEGKDRRDDWMALPTQWT